MQRNRRGSRYAKSRRLLVLPHQPILVPISPLLCFTNSSSRQEVPPSQTGASPGGGENLPCGLQCFPHFPERLPPARSLPVVLPRVVSLTVCRPC